MRISISPAGYFFIAAMLAIIGGGMNVDAGKVGTACASGVVAFACLIVAMTIYHREDAA